MTGIFGSDFRPVAATQGEQDKAAAKRAWLAGLPDEIAGFVLDRQHAVLADEYGNEIPIGGYVGLDVADLAQILSQEDQE